MEIKAIEMESQTLDLVANALFEYYKELEDAIGYAELSVSETIEKIASLEKDLAETREDLKAMKEERQGLFVALQKLGWIFM